jgi:hypothetical protein
MFQICLQNGKSYKVSFIYDYKDKHPVATHCIVKNIANEKIIKGSAFCSPYDQFNKTLGRKLALQRVLCWFEDKFDRTMFWQAYWEALSQN